MGNQLDTQQYKPYSICTPEFEPLSGGIRVMWGLFGHLLAKGELAVTNSTWEVPFIGIYPEIVHGNPLRADKVIRYVLNKPGVMATQGVPGPMTFDPDEEIHLTQTRRYMFSLKSMILSELTMTTYYFYRYLT